MQYFDGTERSSIAAFLVPYLQLLSRYSSRHLEALCPLLLSTLSQDQALSLIDTCVRM